jgi:hypothetical protein
MTAVEHLSDLRASHWLLAMEGFPVGMGLYNTNNPFQSYLSRTDRVALVHHDIQ